MSLVSGTTVILLSYAFGPCTPSRVCLVLGIYGSLAQRFDGHGGWEPCISPPTCVCALRARALEPGAQRADRTLAWQHLGYERCSPSCTSSWRIRQTPAPDARDAHGAIGTEHTGTGSWDSVRDAGASSLPVAPTTVHYGSGTTRMFGITFSHASVGAVGPGRRAAAPAALRNAFTGISGILRARSMHR